ncbi:class I SAM-dependent methyltransferase [Candidatus Nitrospira salsa]
MHISPFTHQSSTQQTYVEQLKPEQLYLETTIKNIKTMVENGGPRPKEYAELNKSMDTLVTHKNLGTISQEQFTEILHAFGAALSTDTIQGFVLHKPHGYAGDFEVIERIYKHYLSSNPNLTNWDRFFHTHKAPQAVRNRVSYFLEQIYTLKTRYPKQARVLNVASGPGRDMYETLKVVGPSNITFDCVDQDLEAIQYAKSLCHDFRSHIHFIHRNVFRFVPQEKYQLIWSAGLFDYFSDSLFKRVIKRLLPSLERNGKLVIGNFSDDNPTQGYMELFDWMLIHRSKKKLQALAEECGVPSKNIWVEQEQEGVNLFLHIVNT